MTDVLRMKRVNVLEGRNCVDNSLFVKLARQWELTENTVYFPIVIKLVYKTEQLLLRGILRERVFTRNNTESLASLFLICNINL